MKKLKYAIPLILAFTIPWLHRFQFDNFMLAFPASSESAVHAAVIFINIGIFYGIFIREITK